MKKVFSVITAIVVALAVIIAAGLVVASLTGIRFFTVPNGSMEPLYSAGDMVVVKKVDIDTIKVGDVITFRPDENSVVTHRVEGIVKDETEAGEVRFRTKGDANAEEDEGLIHSRDVIGMPLISVAGLGYAMSYIQHPPGLYIALGVAAALVLIAFLPDIISGKKEE